MRVLCYMRKAELIILFTLLCIKFFHLFEFSSRRFRLSFKVHGYSFLSVVFCCCFYWPLLKNETTLVTSYLLFLDNVARPK